MGAVFRPADLNLYFAADLPRIVAVPTAERKVEVLRTSLPFPPVVGDAESEFPVRPQAAGKGIDQRHRCTELLAPTFDKLLQEGHQQASEQRRQSDTDYHFCHAETPASTTCCADATPGCVRA
jgi:hypothetical protein